MDRLQKTQCLLNTLRHDMDLNEVMQRLSEWLTAYVDGIDPQGHALVDARSNDPTPFEITPCSLWDALRRKAVSPTQIQSNVPVMTVSMKDSPLDDPSPQGWATLIPIIHDGKSGGTLLLYRVRDPLSEEELVVGIYGAAVVGMVLYQQEQTEKQEREQMQRAMQSLTHSERVAMSRVFASIDAEESIVIASQIADQSHLSRSVIVNGLRKLQSAGVMESRSLGSGGTLIKILSPMLVPTIVEAYPFVESHFCKK